MTAEQFDQLPDDEGCRYELLDGELIEVGNATPGHHHIADRLLVAVLLFLESEKKGTALREVEFAISAQRRLRPNLAVLLGEKWTGLDLWKSPADVIPEVAVEIISPSESGAQVDRKVKAYLDAGVSEVIIVYPDTRHIYVVSRTGAAHFWVGDTLTCATIPGWSIAVDQVFAN